MAKEKDDQEQAGRDLAGDIPLYLKGADDVWRVNPRALAKVGQGQRKFGWLKRVMVNAGPARVLLPEMEKVTLTINGNKQEVWRETGEQIAVEPLGRVEYHEHAMNSPDSPFLVNEMPMDAGHTLTEEQVCGAMDKHLADLDFEKASDNLMKYGADTRPKVINYIIARRQRIAEERRKAEQFAM